MPASDNQNTKYMTEEREVKWKSSASASL